MKKLADKDYLRAAAILGTGVAEIKTVQEVESRGNGFQPDGRPIILFERHIFARYTKGKFNATHPGISNSQPGGYGGSAAQWARFEMAAALDRNAALLSISMGLFQIMGFNFQAAGYPSVDAFFDAMHISEGEQLIAFCRFLKASGLDDELRDHEWRAFARGYNGPAYRRNNYDTKLAAAYKKFAAQELPETGDILEIDWPLPNVPQTDYAPDASVAIPVPPVAATAQEPTTEKAETSIFSIEGLTEVAGQIVKHRDSIKALRTMVSMAGFGTTVAAIGAYFKDNPHLYYLVFVGIAIVAVFAWKYMDRQEKVAIERMRKQ